MKKNSKILIIIFVSIIFLVGIDIESIFLRNRPLFAVESKQKCECKKYIGLFYNTYNCPEYSMSQIKPRWHDDPCSFRIKTNENDGGWYNEIKYYNSLIK